MPKGSSQERVGKKVGRHTVRGRERCGRADLGQVRMTLESLDEAMWEMSSGLGDPLPYNSRLGGDRG